MTRAGCEVAARSSAIAPTPQPTSRWIGLGVGVVKETAETSLRPGQRHNRAGHSGR